jgi:hypothetical protein
MRGPEKIPFLIMLSIAKELHDGLKNEFELDLGNEEKLNILDSIIKERILPKYQELLKEAYK